MRYVIKLVNKKYFCLTFFFKLLLVFADLAGQEREILPNDEMHNRRYAIDKQSFRSTTFGIIEKLVSLMSWRLK